MSANKELSDYQKSVTIDRGVHAAAATLVDVFNWCEIETGIAYNVEVAGKIYALKFYNDPDYSLQKEIKVFQTSDQYSEKNNRHKKND
jgi:hypothetical protein